MFVQPRHDLDEIARPRPVIKLGRENAVPGVAARARRARKAEDESGTGNSGGSTALDGRGADLGVAQHMECDGKTIHPLFKKWLDRLRRYVAPGETGAAGGYDRIDSRIGNPLFYDSADRV